MPAADVDARMIGRNECQRDADILAFSEQVVLVEEAEGEADERRLRPERDVALVPGKSDAERLVALVGPARHVTDVAHRCGVRARRRPREREARNFLALREAWQIVVLLLVGSVLLDKLAGAERVRHHDDRHDVRRARGDLAEDQGLRLRGKAEAAVLLRDQHAEEAMLLDEIPDLLRDLALRMADLPVVDHRAQFVRRAVEERLLLGRKLDRRDRLELVPIGCAGENLGIEADGAGFQCLSFGIRNLGQDLLNDAVDGRDDEAAAERRDRQQCQSHERQPGNPRQQANTSACANERQQANGDRPAPERRAHHAQRQKCG